MDQHSRTAPHPIDVELDALDLFAELALRAVHQLDLHHDADGLCSDCGSAWPCERAFLAANNLEMARPHGSPR
jgi:hypothetical protein